jgi:hypothetical protein
MYVGHDRSRALLGCDLALHTGVRISNELRASGRAACQRRTEGRGEPVDNGRKEDPQAARKSRPETGDLLASKRTARAAIDKPLPPTI